MAALRRKNGMYRFCGHLRPRCPTPDRYANSSVRRVVCQERVKGVESDSNPLVSTENQHPSDAGAAKASVAVSPPMPADADLQTVIGAWQDLPTALKAGVLAMVKAARKVSEEVT